MKGSKSRACALVLVTVAIAGSMASVSASEAAQGPVFPPPGGVDWTPSGAGIGRAGGVVWSYDALDMSLFLDLWWGVAGPEAVALAFDGEVDEPGEIMTFDAGSSDLPAGVARWAGSADVTLTNGSLQLPTRFTLTSGAPLDDESAAGITGAYALVPVAGPYSITLSVEAFHGGAWQPALDVYDALNTLPEAEEVRISIGGGFYFHANQAPTADITSDPTPPVAEEAATLHANAADVDGTVASVAWDLDDDGDYDDASGESISHTFPEEGTYPIAVQVTDDRGLSGTASTLITVVRCDEGTVSGTVHETGEPTVEFLIGEGRAVHELNCDLIAANGL